MKKEGRTKLICTKTLSNGIVERFEVLSNFLNFLTVDQVFGVLAPVSLIMGMGIGFLGSVSTVRKHLHV